MVNHSQTLVQTIYPIPSIFGIDRSLQYWALLKTGLLILGFVAFVSVLAQISFRIPTTTVPITGQTFGVLVTGSVLGSRKGPLVMGIYMLVGMFLLPVFVRVSFFLALNLKNGLKKLFIFNQRDFTS